MKFLGMESFSSRYPQNQRTFEELTDKWVGKKTEAPVVGIGRALNTVGRDGIKGMLIDRGLHNASSPYTFAELQAQFSPE